MSSLSLAFDILARDRASDAFDSAGRSAEHLGEKTSRMSGAMKTALAGATAAVGTFAIQLGGDAIAAAKESMKVSAQTEAAIKSTGASAWVSTEQIGQLAHSLQMMSGVSDETIQSGQNMLLTFTNIRNEAGKGNDIFDQATKAMLDYSVATGTDASSAAVTLGKALNDPIAGLSALGRAGVQFTDAQKAQIETMVAAGDVMGAQKIILGELTTQFGGSAAAAGESMTSAERLSMKWGDMQEQLGTWLIPRINALIDGLMSAAEWIGRNQDVVVPLAAGLGALAAVVVTVTTAAKVYTAVQAALNVVMALNPVGAVVLGIAALAAGLVLAYQKSETFREVVDRAFQLVRRGAELYITPTRVLIEALVGAAGVAGRAFEQFASVVSSKGAEVVSFLRALPGQIVAVFAGIGNTMYGIGERIIEGAINGIKSKAPDLLGAVDKALGGAIGGARKILEVFSPSRVFFRIGEYTMEGFVDGLEAGVGPLNQAIDSIFGGLNGQVSDILGGFGAMDSRAAAQSRLQEARDKLANLRGSGMATDDVLRAAEKDVVAATLQAVSAEQAYVAAQQKLLEQGPDGVRLFEQMAAAAGLTEQEIVSLTGSMMSFQSGVAGLKIGERGPDLAGRAWGDANYGEDLPAEVQRYLDGLHQAEMIRVTPRGPDRFGRKWGDPFYGEDPGTEKVRSAQDLAGRKWGDPFYGEDPGAEKVHVTINAPTSDANAIKNAVVLGLRMA